MSKGLGCIGYISYILAYLIFYLSDFLPILKGTISGLKQFLVNESPLKMMENAFYSTLKALLVLKIFKFLS